MYHTYRVTAETPQYRQDIGQQKSFKFISYDNLTTSYHLLVVNVTECVNQTFTFDYLTYTQPNEQYYSSIRRDWDHESQKTTKKKMALISGNVAGFIVLLLGTVFIIMWRRRSKYPRRKFTYYLKSTSY